MLKKKSLSQYFTTNTELLNTVRKLIRNTDGLILEPSFGQGNLIEIGIETGRPIIGYEIDRTVKLLATLKSKSATLRYCDFLQAKVKETFSTIIGNPPYAKSSTGNLYLDFIKKCVDLLRPDGELIFIVPSDFLRATRASKLITAMNQIGTFTHFYLPNREDLFSDASIDVVVFRYQKTKLVAGMVVLNDDRVVVSYSTGSVVFGEHTGTPIKDLFNIYVGIVSGRDDVFESELGNVEILTDFDVRKKFILIDKFPSENPSINKHLLKNKVVLLERRIKKFNNSNWFKWGALRNIQAVMRDNNKPCIYVKTITRKTPVARIGRVGLFNGSLLCIIPKAEFDITAEILADVCDTINANMTHYLSAGRFKMTHRQLSGILIPYAE